MKRLLLTCTDLMAIQFLVPHVKYLSSHGFSVELACSVVGDRLGDLHRELDGIAPIHTVRLVRSPFSPANRHGYGDLKRIIDGGSYDIIWTNEPVMGVMTRLAARGARRRGTRVVYMVHGFHFYKGAPLVNWMIYYPVEKFCSRFCDMIITINEEDHRRAATFHAKRVEKIPGVGVNLDRFSTDVNTRSEWRKKLGLADDDIALLTVGELHKGKNQQTVIRAIRKINNPHIRYFLCGKGEEEANLKKLAVGCGLKKQVHFLGYRRDIAEIMCACDIFAFLSLREGLPRALMESMASGLPVVCTGIRGNVDLIEDGKGGFVVPGDAGEVADAIKKLIDSPGLRAEMGACNEKAVEIFKEENAVEAVENIMRSVKYIDE